MRPDESLPSFEVGGVRIHAVTLADTLAVLESWIARRERQYVILMGAHGVVEAQDDPELRAIAGGAGLVTNDGMPNVWLGRLKGHKGVEKVYAPDIMNAAYEHGLAAGWRHFLYGGGPGVAERLRARLEERFPGIRIVGAATPPFGEPGDLDIATTVEEIDASRAEIVWVGLGCPKQDRWMARFRPFLEAPVLVGVGAGFDFLSGVKPLAPRWIQRSGFEWLFRALSEPRRLGPRYAVVIPRYLLLVAKELGRNMRGRSR